MGQLPDCWMGLKCLWIFVIMKYDAADVHLELEPSHPDHHRVPRDAEHDGQRVDNDADVVHDGFEVHLCRLAVLGGLGYQGNVG